MRRRQTCSIIKNHLVITYNPYINSMDLEIKIVCKKLIVNTINSILIDTDCIYMFMTTSKVDTSAMLMTYSILSRLRPLTVKEPYRLYNLKNKL